MHIDSLFIKQAAIVEVIQEQGLANFSTLKRQFMGIGDRTLRYHLKRLVDMGLIKKRRIYDSGKTQTDYHDKRVLVLLRPKVHVK